MFLWRPLVAWSDRFKFEQSGSGDVPKSVVLEWIQGSAWIEWVIAHTFEPSGRWLNRVLSPPRPALIRYADEAEPSRSWLQKNWKGLIAMSLVTVIVAWGAIASVRELTGLSGKDWGTIGMGAGATFLRTLAALILAAAWTIPVGVAIGTNPKWSHRAQPIIQIIASVPATAVFPLLLAVLLGIPGGLNVAAILLMLLGTQWYVLFNVVAGAMAIPSDLREAAVNYQVTGWRRWKTLILPAIFPYLVTGMITATGGAWNASIVSEFVTIPPDQTRSTLGLGALITESANSGNFPLLLASTLVMAGIVITGNRLVWRRLYGLAATRYRLD
jgi:NitT/TauT family transport system permease protein